MRVSPSTCLIPLLAGVLILASACGEPPQALPTSPPYASGADTSADTVLPSPPVITQPVPTGGLPTGGLPTGALPPAALPTGLPPVYPTRAPTATAPITKSPTPTPSHAAKCAGEPTGAQILAFIAGKDGIPTDPLKVDSGPFCSGTWSFTTVQIAGRDDDESEPLMVVTTGKGDTLVKVAAGSDVCSSRVQTDAPAGIRVLACGF